MATMNHRFRAGFDSDCLLIDSVTSVAQHTSLRRCTAQEFNSYSAFLRWILQSLIILVSLYHVALVKLYFWETFVYKYIPCVIDTIICIKKIKLHICIWVLQRACLSGWFYILYTTVVALHALNWSSMTMKHLKLKKKFWRILKK